MDKKRGRYSESQNKATQKYHAMHMEEIKCRAQRSERINARMAIAANMQGISKAQYMLDAIRARLDADGVRIDDLPPE